MGGRVQVVRLSVDAVCLDPAAERPLVQHGGRCVAGSASRLRAPMPTQAAPVRVARTSSCGRRAVFDRRSMPRERQARATSAAFWLRGLPRIERLAEASSGRSVDVAGQCRLSSRISKVACGDALGTWVAAVGLGRAFNRSAETSSRAHHEDVAITARSPSDCAVTCRAPADLSRRCRGLSSSCGAASGALTVRMVVRRARRQHYREMPALGDVRLCGGGVTRCGRGAIRARGPLTGRMGSGR